MSLIKKDYQGSEESWFGVEFFGGIADSSSQDSPQDVATSNVVCIPRYKTFHWCNLSFAWRARALDSLSAIRDPTQLPHFKCTTRLLPGALSGAPL